MGRLLAHFRFTPLSCVSVYSVVTGDFFYIKSCIWYSHRKTGIASESYPKDPIFNKIKIMVKHLLGWCSESCVTAAQWIHHRFIWHRSWFQIFAMNRRSFNCGKQNWPRSSLLERINDCHTISGASCRFMSFCKVLTNVLNSFAHDEDVVEYFDKEKTAREERKQYIFPTAGDFKRI